MEEKGAKFYDMVESLRGGRLSTDKTRELNSELSEEQFDLFSEIDRAVASDDSDIDPSGNVSDRLKSAFQQKHEDSKVRKLSFAIDISAIDRSKLLSYSMKIAAIGLLMLSLKLSFNPEPSFYSGSGLLADTIQEPAIDSALISVDSLRF